MGLDLVVEGCPKPGCESEWRRLLERSFAGKELSKADVARFQEISIPGYQRIGAPRVGFDKAADAWIIKSAESGNSRAHSCCPEGIPRILRAAPREMRRRGKLFQRWPVRGR